MDEPDIHVEVAFAKPDNQVVIEVQLGKGKSVLQAINESGILQQCPEIDQAEMYVGIYGKACKLEKVVEQGDRIEIYRPLMQHPMDARRNRAVKT